MTESSLTPAVRQAVRERAGFCCEYHFSQARYCPDPLSIDHIEPRSGGGSDELSNLAGACQGCNGHKYAKKSGVDPVTEEPVTEEEVVPLYHSRRHVWSDHFEWSTDFVEIIGSSATGRATGYRLPLNRQAVVNLRVLLKEFGRHPQSLILSSVTPDLTEPNTAAKYRTQILKSHVWQRDADSLKLLWLSARNTTNARFACRRRCTRPGLSRTGSCR